jgi:hypothetical protein
VRRALFLAGLIACSTSEGAAPPGPDGGGPSAPDSTTPGGNGDNPDGGAGADAAPPIRYEHFDVNHVLSTGQSDCVANGGVPVLTTAQPFGNLSFDVGVMTGQNSATTGCDGEGCRQYQTPTRFVPLVEGDVFLESNDPGGYTVETMSAGLANQASSFATTWFPTVGLPSRPHDILVSVHGRSGNTYWCLKKNYCSYLADQGYLSPFGEAMMQVTSAKALATAAGKSYVVRGVTAIHGGSDHYDTNNGAFPDGEFELKTLVEKNDGSGLVGNYTNALLEWQKDYETGIQAITKQTQPVPLFISQFGSWTDRETSVIPVRQLAAHVAAPGKIIVVTPNYPFEHHPDCLHYTNHSQRRLGAYFAKAYQRVAVEGGVWEPVRPSSVTREGATLTVKFVVPKPPLVLDTDRVAALPDGHFGFTYADDAGSAGIAAVRLAGPDTVTITLSRTPTAGGRTLRYAINLDPDNACPGPERGARGNLRDSDTTPGYHKDGDGKPYELHNWAVHFAVPVP